MLLLKSDEYVGHSASVRVLTRDPQYDYPEHCHDFSELVLVSSGCGSHIVNGKHSVMLPNSVMCISDKDYHLYVDNKDVHLFNILYNKQSLKVSSLSADIIKRLERQQSHFLLTQEAFTPLQSMAEKIVNEQRHAGQHSYVMISLMFEQLLLMIDRLSVEQVQNSPLINAVIFLCNNYQDQELSINDVCEKFKVSPKALSNKLVQLTGLSTNRFLNHLRMRKALALLKQGNSITDVAFQVGFNDSNYFSTKFKSVMGYSPREFRHQLPTE